MPRIGLLWIKSDSSPMYIERLRAGLRAQGYEAGRDVVIDDRYLVNGYAELEAATQSLARAQTAVIITQGTTATEVASRVAPDIPIVSVAAGDLVHLGVAASLAHPGGNVTGFTTMSSELSSKRLDILREIVPGLRRFAVLFYPGSQSEVEGLRNYEALALSAQLEVRAVPIRDAAEIDTAIAAIAGLGVQGIVVVGSSLFGAQRERIVAAIARLRLPAVYSNATLVEGGGLVAFVADVPENFFRAAIYVDKILKGAKPGELPIEQPRKWELILNMKAAKALGWKPPQRFLMRVDRVIE